MLNDATREAILLLVELRSLRADDAVAEAEFLASALDHEPVRHVMGFIWEALERIDAGLPLGAQAEGARTRLSAIAITLEALDADAVQYGT